MALSSIRPGMTARLFMQAGTSPVPLTDAQLNLVASITPIIGTKATTTTPYAPPVATVGSQVNVQNIPEFGADSAAIKLPLAGAQFKNSVPIQAELSDMQLDISFNFDDPVITVIDGVLQPSVTAGGARTFVLVVPDNLFFSATQLTAAQGTAEGYGRAFNAFFSGFKLIATTDNAFIIRTTLVLVGGTSWSGPLEL